MVRDYDVAIIGGALSGAALAVLLRREHGAMRVLIVERAEQFDRKVGEATTEVAGHYLHRRLSMTHHLQHNHLIKQGLRMWFAESANTPFDECVEIGANFQVRMPSFQVDREVLDEYMLRVAVAEGTDLWRPAKVEAVEIGPPNADLSRLRVRINNEMRQVRARWIVDASGRAAVLARKFGYLKPLTEHPTNAIWARFRGVKDWDGHELRSKHPRFASSCIASRAAATNHLTGFGWWCWIIPLKHGDYSAGLVYDSRLYTPPEGSRLSERLKTHLMRHPVGREIFRDAEPIENDSKAYSLLPYYSERLCGPGWQLIGDAAGFLDPLYSPGLDFCSWTGRTAFARIMREYRGERVDLDVLNERFQAAYHGWFTALYKDKYYYLGDAELMTAAYLLDIGFFYLGPVREIAVAPECDLECLPFNGPIDGFVGKVMALYNRRLAHLAQKRMAAGCYGRGNTGWRHLIEGFVPDLRVRKQLMRGLRRWIAAEIHGLFLPSPAKAGAATTGSPRPETAPAN